MTKMTRIPEGFDVVCTIGRVTFGDGDRTPMEVAFELIARHGAEGTFSFPNEVGGTIHVTVEGLHYNPNDHADPRD